MEEILATLKYALVDNPLPFALEAFEGFFFHQFYIY